MAVQYNILQSFENSGKLGHELLAIPQSRAANSQGNKAKKLKKLKTSDRKKETIIWGKCYQNTKSVPLDHVEKLVTFRNNAGKQFTAKMYFIDNNTTKELTKATN